MSPSGVARRIAVVHGFYSSRTPSGENVVVNLQVRALLEAGYDVEVFSIHQETAEEVPLYQVRAAARVATGRGASPSLAHFAPDVVHVHNLFPNFGRRWVRKLGPRVVATLHNFRPICPAGTLFRDGSACTECPSQGNALPALRHGCYKSRLATLPVAIGTRMARDPLLESAARLVVLSDVMKEHYVAAGVDEHRMVTIPNFVLEDSSVAAAASRSGWVYVGRLTPEKGIDRLIARWPAGERLTVLGDGPLMATLRGSAGPNVEFLGSVGQPEVRKWLASSRGLVFPSLWPEGLPTVYLEALATGTPVLASRESIVGSLVASEGTGAVMGSDLELDLRSAGMAFGDLSRRCRDVFETTYSQHSWSDAIGRLYEGVALSAKG